MSSSACGTHAITVVVSVHVGSKLVKETYAGFSSCAHVRGASARVGVQGPGRRNVDFLVGADPTVLGDNNPGGQSLIVLPPRP